MKIYSPTKNRLRRVIKLIIVIPFFVLFIFIGSSLIRLINIQVPNPTSLETLYKKNGNKNLTKTLVILGIDEDRNINTEFVDFLSLITIDDRTKEIKILNINTKYTWYIQKSNQYIPFKSLLVFYKTFYPQENYIESFISAVEKLSSIRVDGYVVVTKNGLEELSPVISPVKVTAPSNLEDMDIPGYTIKKGENNLKETDILKFVSADDNGDNDKLQRQLSTIQSLITNFEIHKLFINQQSIIEIVEKEMKTNLTGEDLLNLFIKLKLGQYKFKVGYTDSTTAIQIENELDERWYTVYNTLDKDIQKVYINEDVKMEQAKIDIFNATNLPGLARSRARGLSNKGLRVVLVGNTDKKFEKTTIYLNTEKDYPNTLNEIYNTLDSNAIEIKHEKYDGRSVGDIVVVLGNNEIV